LTSNCTIAGRVRLSCRKMRLLTLCRYEDKNTLRRSDIDIDSTSYIAISYIWAQAEWHSNLGRDESRIAKSLNRPGLAYRDNGELDTAIDWFERAKEIYRQSVGRNEEAMGEVT
jgi:tetratricopeptide (TPR) repeat protein